VTEGNGAFYASRNLIQMLHDFGNHKSIVVHSSEPATAKKALFTRQARYSGLLDTLDFSDAKLAAADAWLAINADEAALPAQIAAAREAGIKRAFLLLTADGPTPFPTDSAAMEAMLEESGLSWTIMRTGNLVEGGAIGGGLRLGEVDMAVCGDVSKEDVYRFVTEALTLPDSERRSFSLCPSEETEASLKQMRLCGYERREEVQALLQGHITPPVDEVSQSEAEAEEAAELVMRSEAEVAAEREEELKMLLARARERGLVTAAKLKYEEEEKARQREEMSSYYQAPTDGTPADEGGAGGEGADDK